jgi:hypothetical protein
VGLEFRPTGDTEAALAEAVELTNRR